MIKTILLVGLIFSLMPLIGCGGTSGNAPLACANPAPLDGSYDPAAPGYIVMFRAGTDAAAETARLAQKYGFTTGPALEILPGFSAELTPAALAGVRCESTVLRVTYNSAVAPTGR